MFLGSSLGRGNLDPIQCSCRKRLKGKRLNERKDPHRYADDRSGFKPRAALTIMSEMIPSARNLLVDLVASKP